MRRWKENWELKEKQTANDNFWNTRTSKHPNWNLFCILIGFCSFLLLVVFWLGNKLNFLASVMVSQKVSKHKINGFERQSWLGWVEAGNILRVDEMKKIVCHNDFKPKWHYELHFVTTRRHDDNTSKWLRSNDYASRWLRKQWLSKFLRNHCVAFIVILSRSHCCKIYEEKILKSPKIMLFLHCAPVYPQSRPCCLWTSENIST